MLFVVGTRFHTYTLDTLTTTDCGGHGVWIVTVSYDDLFSADLLMGGTYVFTDIDRLAPYERLLAAAVFRTMAEQPDRFRPLNDPALVRTRFALLRALNEAGINQFDAYSAEAQPRPRRFPVFVRAGSRHDKPLTDLLRDQRQLDEALHTLERAGTPLEGLIVIEYTAEPVLPGIWRRYTAYLIGGELLIDVPLSGASWIVKRDEHLVDDATYDDDIVAMRTDRDADILRQAFAIGRIDYGRLDFGIIGGRVQVYEINTNPNFRGLDAEHPSAVRRAGRLLAWQRLTHAMAALAGAFATSEAAPFAVPLLREFREKNGGTTLPWCP